MKKNFIERNRQKWYVNSLSNDQLSNDIDAKENENRTIDEEIDSLKASLEDLETRQAERIAELDRETGKYVAILEDSNKDIAKQLENLRKDEKKYAEKYQSMQLDLEKKMNVLVARRKEMIESEIAGNEKATAEKEKIEDQLRELIASGEEQREVYEQRLLEYDKQLEEANKKYLEEKKKINDNLEAARKEGKRKIDELEDNRVKMQEAQHEEMDRLNQNYKNEYESRNYDLAEIMESKRSKLNELIDRVDDLRQIKDRLSSELDSRKKYLDGEYNDLVSQSEQTKETAHKSNEALMMELDSKREMLNETIARDKKEYDRKEAELNELIETFEHLKIADLQKNDNELTQTQKELKDRYSAYVGQLDDKYVKEKEKIDDEINNLKFEYNQKRDTLSKRNAQYKEKLDSIRENYQNEMQKRRNELDNSNKDLEDTIASLALKESQLKEENDNFKTQSEEALKAKKEEYDALIAKRRSDLERDITNSDARTEELNAQIALLNQEIADLQEKARVLEETTKSKEEILARNQQEFITNIQLSNESLSKSIATVEEKTQAEANQRQDSLRALEERKVTVTEEHEAEMEKIALQAQSNLDAVKRQYKEDFDKAGRDHNDKMDDLRSSGENKKAEMAQELDKFEEASETTHNEIANEIDKVKRESESRIADIRLQNSAILEQIDDIKKKSAATIKKLNEERAETDSAYKLNLSVIENERADALSELDRSLKDVNVKRATLADLTGRAEDLRQQRDRLAGELESKKQYLESEYNALANQSEQTKATAQKGNEVLMAELETKRVLLNETITKDKKEYDRLVGELNDTIESYRRVKLNDLQKNEDELASVQKELKERYESHVSQLEAKYVKEKERVEDEISALKYQNSQKRDELNKKNTQFKEKLDNMRGSFQKEIQKRSNELENSRKNLENIRLVLTTNETSLKEEIAELKTQSEETLKTKKADYDNQIVKKRQALDKETTSFTSKIEDMNSQIVLLSQEVVDYQEKIRTLEESTKAKKEVLIRNQEEYVTNTKLSHEAINKSIAALEEKMQAELDQHQNAIKELDDKKAIVADEYTREVKAITTESADRLEAVKKQFKDDYAKATKESNQKLNDLKTATEQKKAQLMADEENFEAASEANRNEISVQIENLKEDSENRIAAIRLQNSNTLAQIDEIKKKNDSIVKKLNEEREAIERSHKINAETIENDRVEAMNLLDKALKDVNQKLEDTTKALSEKKSELDSMKIRYEQEKANLAAELSDQTAVCESKKKTAENDLEIAKAKLQRLSDLNAKKISDRTNELVMKRKGNDDYRKQTSDAIAALKEEKEELKQNTIMELEQKLKEFIERCNGQEQEYRKQCEHEIEAKRNELKVKQDSINKLVDAIMQRKYTTSAAFESKYQRELEKANELEAEYEKYSKSFEMERVELVRQLEAQKIRNEESIKALKEDNRALIEKKTAEFQALMDAQNAKRKEAEQEIQNITAEISNTAEEYRTYKINEDTHMSKMKLDTDNYLNEIANRVASLVSEEYSLNQAHEAKLEAIVADINSVREEYDALLKAKPVSIQEVEEESIQDIEKQKEEFRARMSTAEDAFALMKAEIEANRNELLESISKDIEKVVNGEKETLDKHESDVVALSKTYERMIAEEQHRQMVFSDKLTEKKKVREEFMNENEKVSGETLAGFNFETEVLGENLKKELADISAESEEKANENFRKQKELDEKIAQLNGRLEYLKKNYELYDTQLAEQKRIIIQAYSRKISSIKTAYTRALESQRSRFQNVDFMSDDVLDIFRKNQA